MKTSTDICKSLDIFSNICSLTSDNFGFVVGTVITLILILTVIIAVFYLIYGGVRWILSRGDKEQVENARTHIVAAIIGLAIVFLSFFTVNIVFGFFFPGQSIQNLTLPSLGPDRKPPTVSIVSPISDSTISGKTLIQANAKDNKEVTKVEFYVDGILKNTDTKEPFEYSLDTKFYKHNSPHAILAKAYDSFGNIGISESINVVVADITKPAVSITNLRDNGTVLTNTSINIFTIASDVSGIAQVEFRINGVLKCTDIAAPYSCLWKIPTAKGVIYRIEVAAYDTAGNIGTIPISVTAD